MADRAGGDVLAQRRAAVNVSESPPQILGATMSSRRGLAPGRLWSLWDMLLNHFPIYEITVDLQKLRVIADRYLASKIGDRSLNDLESAELRALLEKVQRECPQLGLVEPAEIAESIAGRPTPETYRELSIELAHLGDSLGRNLKKEGIFRIHPDLKNYYEQDALFGPEVAAAFPSCERDIRKAGSCYALEQEDGREFGPHYTLSSFYIFAGGAEL